MRQAGTGAPAPTTLATGSRALALSGLGDYRHSLCFWPGRALLPFFIPSQKPGPPSLLCQSFCGWGGGRGGGPSLLFLPPTPEGHAESACLPEATALTSGLGQVKGTWVTQHQEEKAEESLTGGQRELLFKCQDILAA